MTKVAGLRLGVMDWNLKLPGPSLVLGLYGVLSCPLNFGAILKSRKNASCTVTTKTRALLLEQEMATDTDDVC